MDDNNDKRRKKYIQRKYRLEKGHIFDVKATRTNDYYLTITESKRRYRRVRHEKHKPFL